MEEEIPPDQDVPPTTPPPTTPPPTTPPPTQPPACPTGQRWNRYRRRCEDKGPMPPGGGGYPDRNGEHHRPPKEPHPPRGGWNSCNRWPWRYRNCHDYAKWWYFRYRRWPSWWFWGDVWPIPFGWPGGRGRSICSAVFGGSCNRECGPRGSPTECLDCSYACGPSWRTFGLRSGLRMGDVNVYNITNEFTNEGYGAPREGEEPVAEAPPPPPPAPTFDINSLMSNPMVLIGGVLILMMFMMKK